MGKEKGVRLCWDRLGDKMGPADVVRVQCDMPSPLLGSSPWLFGPPHLAKGRAKRLLLPLVRRDYLSDRSPVPLVSDRLQGLEGLKAEVLDRLLAWARAGDERCTRVWDLMRCGDLSDDLARKVKSCALTTEMWQVTPPAFWKYLETRAGRRELAKHGGLSPKRSAM